MRSRAVGTAERVIAALLVVVFTASLAVEFLDVGGLIGHGRLAGVLEALLVAFVAAPALWLIILGPMHRLRVAERERVARELLETEDRYRRLVQLAPDAILVSIDGRVVYANEAAARLLGAPSPGALEGKPFLDFIHPDHRAPVINRMRAMAATDEPAPPIVQKLIRLDGALVGAEARACPILFSGRPAILAIVRDITERAAAEERLRIQAAALDAAANAIIITDRDLRIQWVNEAFAALTGYALEDAVGRTPRFLRANTRDAATFDETAATLATGRPWHGEVMNRRKDGSTYLADVSFTPVRDGRGEVVRFVGVGQNVTERRTLESELRQAQKMEAVGQLAGGIAHDFNNLLTTILASSGLMEEHVPEGSPLREEVRLVRYSAERGAELTQKLLAFSRRQRLELRRLDLSELVGGFTRMARRVLREDIAVKIAFAEPAWVNADSGAVEEVLMNLVTNARDAMPTGGTLSFAIERRTLDAEAAAAHDCPTPGDYVVMSVSDTGVGMSAETLRRLFEPFFTTKPVGSGTGLGLSMVYGLVKQHGGCVSVYSEVGKGTTFRVFFPAAEAAVASSAGAARQEARGGTETILVAEDEPGLRRAAQRVLEKHGYTVLLAEDGTQALDILARRNGDVALLVSDVVMPRMGGAQLYRALREQGYRVPVLLTSGYTARDLEETAELAATVPFLTKPWTVADLLKRVREVLDAPETAVRS